MKTSNKMCFAVIFVLIQWAVPWFELQLPELAHYRCLWGRKAKISWAPETLNKKSGIFCYMCIFRGGRPGTRLSKSNLDSVEIVWEGINCSTQENTNPSCVLNTSPVMPKNSNKKNIGQKAGHMKIIPYFCQRFWLSSSLKAFLGLVVPCFFVKIKILSTWPSKKW